MVCRDLYLRYTNASGNSFDVEHRVWDAERFLKSCQDDADKENDKARSEAKNPGAFIPMAGVQVITRQDYVAGRAATKPAN